MEQDTRLKVLTAAAELISTRGYYHVSVREICLEAGVTKPVLYYYFKDKEDVLVEIIKESHTRFVELMEKYIHPEESFEENLEGLYKVYISYVKAYPSFIKISTHVQLSPLPEKIKKMTLRKKKELVQFIITIFEKGIKEKYFKPSDDSMMLIHSLLAPMGMFIAQSMLFKDNKNLLKDNLEKYFEFWKTHFLKKEN
jgi:AcrR family transcriptional regulator